MKSKILIIIATLSLIISMSFFAYALLKDTQNTNKVTYELGEIGIELDGEIMANYIFPGINLVTKQYTITNTGNIDIEVRFKIVITLDGSPVQDLLEEDGFDIEDFGWDLNSDGYYYHDDTLGTDVSNKSLTIFSKIVLNGHVVKSNYSDDQLKIFLVVHARQSKYAEWSDLGGKFIN